MYPLALVKELPMTGLRRMIAALDVATMLFSEGGVARAAVNHHIPKASLPACVLGKQLMAGVSNGWTQFGQVSGANFTLGKAFRGQAEATFLAAAQSDRVPYFQFDGPPGPGVVEALQRYGSQFGIQPVIDLRPLGGG
jgi:hypothetical protein